MNENPLIKKKNPKTISLQSFGCRLNQYESDGIVQKLVSSGNYTLENNTKNPDYLIINSCTVTNQADKKSLTLLRKFKKNNPNSKVIFTGCYAQTDSDILQKNNDIDLVVGNKNKSSIPSLIDTIPQDTISQYSKITQETQTGIASQHDHNLNKPILENPFDYGLVYPQGHIRAYLKIQDGCDRKCSYCKIPQARGLGVSRSLNDIIEHVQQLDDAHVPEIIVTGVNLGWYKYQDGNKTVGFSDLIKIILNTLTFSRLRLSSIEPCDIDTQIAELTLHPKLCNFLHIPLQSGSRSILKRMRRTYSQESFIKRIDNVRSINPDIFIGTDVIVGFPGETEEEFQETIDVCRQTRMANIHGFRFSKRTGTAAANLLDQVPLSIMKKRMQRLAFLAEELRFDYIQDFLNKPLIAILEKIKTSSQSKTKEAFGELLTDNFLRVKIPFRETLSHNKGDLLKVVIHEYDKDKKSAKGHLC